MRFTKRAFIVLAALVVLPLLALVARAARDRSVRPRTEVSVADQTRSRTGDANPTPNAGTVILGPAPIDRARAELAAMTEKDPVVLRVGSIGRGAGDGTDLNLTLENRGACAVKELSGVAYGYDAYGMPSKVNVKGEYYLAFSFAAQNVAPKVEVQLSASVKHADIASLVLAHVDSVVCADGTKWARGK